MFRQEVLLAFPENFPYNRRLSCQACDIRPLRILIRWGFCYNMGKIVHVSLQIEI